MSETPNKDVLEPLIYPLVQVTLGVIRQVVVARSLCFCGKFFNNCHLFSFQAQSNIKILSVAFPLCSFSQSFVSSNQYVYSCCTISIRGTVGLSAVLLHLCTASQSCPKSPDLFCNVNIPCLRPDLNTYFSIKFTSEISL